MPVAIKKIREEFCEDESFKQMFLEESRISLSLSHSAIVRIFSVGHSAGELFLEMEYIHGRNLRAFTRLLREQGRRWSIAAALFITREIADALEYLSEPEIHVIKRDVSPQDIMIDYAGRVLLSGT